MDYLAKGRERNALRLQCGLLRLFEQVAADRGAPISAAEARYVIDSWPPENWRSLAVSVGVRPPSKDTIALVRAHWGAM